MAELRGGNFASFSASMASEIELAFNEVLVERGLDPLPIAGADEEDLRNRRMLYLAIARGVIRHLVANPGAFKISVAVDSLGYHHASLAIDGTP